MMSVCRYSQFIFVGVLVFSQMTLASHQNCDSLVAQSSLSLQAPAKQPDLSDASKIFLVLIDLGFKNIVSERMTYLNHVQDLLTESRPVNPFMNVDDPLAVALSNKVEDILPQLAPDWQKLQRHISEMLHTYSSVQTMKVRDKMSTRTVHLHDLIPVMLAENLDSKLWVQREVLKYIGQTQAEYYFAIIKIGETKPIRIFRLLKQDLTYSESALDSIDGLMSMHDSTARSALSVFDVECRVIVDRRSGSRTNVQVQKGLGSVIQTNRAIISFSYWPTESSNSSLERFLPFNKDDAQADFLLHMHTNPGGLLHLMAIDRDAWIANPVQVLKGPATDLEGNWLILKNMKDEILLRFISVDGIEVAMWKFFPSTLSFELLVHEVLPGEIYPLNAFCDYESKSVIGWSLSDRLMIFHDDNADISARGGTP